MNLLPFRIKGTLGNRGIFLILKRFKTKAQIQKESSPSRKALQHFDDFYKAVFGERWHSIRLGLLSKQKYFAVLNNFGDSKETEEDLRNQGAFNLKEFLDVQKNYVEDSNAKNEEEQENKIELESIMQQQLLKEEEKESEVLHPEGLEFKAKVDYYNQKNDESNENGSYDPEDPRTSLESDLKMSQIDRSRLIIPGTAADATTLHEFIPATQLRGVEGFIAESDYYKYYRVGHTSLLSFEEEHELDFPENLLVYTFDRGEILDFPDPKKCSNNLYNYMKVDGGDLLAALALNVKYNDAVLDMCSTSRSISYCIFQTLRPKILFCANDLKCKTEKLFYKYFYEHELVKGNMLFITSSSVNEADCKSLFDKVLVDVPCTFDRTAILDETDNMFHVTQLRERLKLPETQCKLLVKGMSLVRPGGTVIYTTATLSPVQNEGVVNEALKCIMKTEKLRFTVKKLSPALKYMSFFFKFADYLDLKFGTLVVPFTPVNFGPRYICKLVRDNEPEENEVV